MYGCSGQYRTICLQLAEPLCSIHQERGADPSYLHWLGCMNRSTYKRLNYLFIEPAWASVKEAQSEGEVWACIHLKLGGLIASEENRKESWVIEQLMEGSIRDGSITQQSETFQTRWWGRTDRMRRFWAQGEKWIKAALTHDCASKLTVVVSSLDLGPVMTTIKERVIVQCNEKIAQWSSRWFEKPGDRNTATKTQATEMHKWVDAQMINFSKYWSLLLLKMHLNYLYKETCHPIAHKPHKNLCQRSSLNTFSKSHICTQTLVVP